MCIMNSGKKYVIMCQSMKMKQIIIGELSNMRGKMNVKKRNIETYEIN